MPVGSKRDARWKTATFGDARQRRKKFLVLEGERFQYQRFISDISGQDVKAYNNDAAEAVKAVREWLSDQVDAKKAVPGRDRISCSRTSRIAGPHRRGWNAHSRAIRKASIRTEPAWRGFSFLITAISPILFEGSQSSVMESNLRFPSRFLNGFALRSSPTNPGLNKGCCEKGLSSFLLVLEKARHRT
jgi:hypothetical protein